jgi:hypothetical protein
LARQHGPFDLNEPFPSLPLDKSPSLRAGHGAICAYFWWIDRMKAITAELYTSQFVQIAAG